MKIDWKTERGKDESYELARVTACDGGWTVEASTGICFFVESALCAKAPKAGETARIIGNSIRGIEIGGRCYRYRTRAEDEELHRTEVLVAQAKRQSEADAQGTERDAKVAAMPELFRERIERFRRVTPNFRRDHEPYEIFVCEQAILFAEKLKTIEKLREFAEADYKDQRKIIPKLSRAHSGNTFGMAVKLAHLSLEKPELIPKMHGALCPLVGCKEYGCFAAHEGASNGTSPRD